MMKTDPKLQLAVLGTTLAPLGLNTLGTMFLHGKQGVSRTCAAPGCSERMRGTRQFCSGHFRQLPLAAQDDVKAGRVLKVEMIDDKPAA